MKKDTDMGESFGNETDAAYDKVKSKQEKSEKAKNVLRGAGYARGGGVSPVKCKRGGKIEGKKAHERADKYKRGGSVPKGHNTRVNINMGASMADKQAAMKKGVALGAHLAAAKMGGGPRPGAGAPMQARPMPVPPPAGGPPGVPPTMGAKRGGRIEGVKHLTGGAGAGGGEGRLAKMKSYGTKPKA